MAVKFSLTTTVTPQKLSAAKVRGHLLAALQHEEDKVLEDLEACVSTWDDKPVFDSKIRFARGDVELEVSTDHEVFGYINGGTSIRWAVMSRDWVSKTEPGVIGSFTGQGRVAVRGKQKMMQMGIPPRPGIEARDFTGEIVKLRQDGFVIEVQEAVRRGMGISP